MDLTDEGHTTQATHYTVDTLLTEAFQWERQTQDVHALLKTIRDKGNQLLKEKSNRPSSQLLLEDNVLKLKYYDGDTRVIYDLNDTNITECRINADFVPLLGHYIMQTISDGFANDDGKVPAKDGVDQTVDLLNINEICMPPKEDVRVKAITMSAEQLLSLANSKDMLSIKKLIELVAEGQKQENEKRSDLDSLWKVKIAEDRNPRCIPVVSACEQIVELNRQTVDLQHLDNEDLVNIIKIIKNAIKQANNTIVLEDHPPQENSNGNTPTDRNSNAGQGTKAGTAGQSTNAGNAGPGTNAGTAGQSTKAGTSGPGTNAGNAGQGTKAGTGIGNGYSANNDTGYNSAGANVPKLAEKQLAEKLNTYKQFAGTFLEHRLLKYIDDIENDTKTTQERKLMQLISYIFLNYKNIKKSEYENYIKARSTFNDLNSFDEYFNTLSDSKKIEIIDSLIEFDAKKDADRNINAGQGTNAGTGLGSATGSNGPNNAKGKTNGTGANVPKDELAEKINTYKDFAVKFIKKYGGDDTQNILSEIEGFNELKQLKDKLIRLTNIIFTRYQQFKSKEYEEYAKANPRPELKYFRSLQLDDAKIKIRLDIIDSLLAFDAKQYAKGPNVGNNVTNGAAKGNNGAGKEGNLIGGTDPINQTYLTYLTYDELINMGNLTEDDNKFLNNNINTADDVPSRFMSMFGSTIPEEIKTAQEQVKKYLMILRRLNITIEPQLSISQPKPKPSIEYLKTLQVNLTKHLQQISSTEIPTQIRARNLDVKSLGLAGFNYVMYVPSKTGRNQKQSQNDLQDKDDNLMDNLRRIINALNTIYPAPSQAEEATTAPPQDPAPNRNAAPKEAPPPPQAPAPMANVVNVANVANVKPVVDKNDKNYVTQLIAPGASKKQKRTGLVSTIQAINLDKVIDCLKAYLEMVDIYIQDPIMVRLHALDKTQFEHVVSGLFTGRLSSEAVRASILLFSYVDVSSMFVDSKQFSHFKWLRNQIIAKDRGILKIDDRANDTEIYRHMMGLEKNQAKGRSFIHIQKFRKIVSFLLKCLYSNNNEYALPTALKLMQYIVVSSEFYGGYVCRVIEKLKGDEMFREKLVKAVVKDMILTYVRIRSGTRENPDERMINKRYGITIANNTIGIDYKTDDSTGDEGKKKKNASANATSNSNSASNTGEFPVRHFVAGPFTRVFGYINDRQGQNKYISEHCGEIIQRLKNNDVVFVIGYGASGSGKTSSLVYLKTERMKENGILLHMCSELGSAYLYAKLEVYELYIDGNDKSRRKLEFYFVFNGGDYKLFIEDADKKYMHQNRFTINRRTGEAIKDHYFDSNSTLGDVITHMIADDRFEMATTNNPQSSRSHVLAVIKFGEDGSNVEQQQQQPRRPVLIIGDFAGVENMFECNNTQVLDNFSRIQMSADSSKLFYSNMPYSTDLKNKLQCNNAPLTNDIPYGKEWLDKLNEHPTVKDIVGRDVYKLGLMYGTPYTENDINAAIKQLRDVKIKIQKSIYLYDATDEQLRRRKDSKGNNLSEDAIQDLKRNDNVTATDEELLERPIEVIDLVSLVVKTVGRMSASFGLLGYISEEHKNEYEKYFKQHNIESKYESKLPYYSFIKTFIDNDDSYIQDAHEQVNRCISQNVQAIESSSKKRKKVVAWWTPDDISAQVKLEMVNESGNSVDQVRLITRNPAVYKKEEVQHYKFQNPFVIDGKKVDIKYKNNNLRFEIVDDVDDDLINITIRKLLDKVHGISMFNVDPKDPTRDTLNDVKDGLSKLTEFTAAARDFMSLSKLNECRLEQMKKACELRRNEGVFINQSLQDLRKFIKSILYEKTKMLMLPAPRFIDSCIKQYCAPDGSCFKLEKVNKQSNPGEIMKCLQESIGERIYDITFVVFCMLFVGTKIPDPPSVPYIFVNDLVKAISYKTNVQQEVDTVRREILKYGRKTESIKKSSGFEAFNTIHPGDPLYNVYAQQLVEACKQHNAASIIGTIEFTDEMAKMMTVPMMCALDRDIANDNTVLQDGQPYEQYENDETEGLNVPAPAPLIGGAHYTSCVDRHSKYDELVKKINGMTSTETNFKAHYRRNTDGGDPDGEYSGLFIMQHMRMKQCIFRVLLPKECLSELFENVFRTYVQGKALHIISQEYYVKHTELHELCERASEKVENSMKTILRELKIT